MTHWLLVMPIFIPLLTATACAFSFRARSLSSVISWCGAIANLCVAVLLMQQVISNGLQVTAFGDWKAPFGIVFVADLLSASMVLITAIIGIAIVLYSTADLRSKPFYAIYHSLIHALLAGVMGSFLTGDIFNLYVFFEVMLITSFGLMVLGANKEQVDAAVKYVVLNLISTMVFLLAIGLLYGATGTLNMADLHAKVAQLPDTTMMLISGLFLFGFAIKASAFPVFSWLPASYHHLPSAIVALYAALLTKVGVYALMRVFTIVFDLVDSGYQPLLIVIAGLTMLTGVLGAASQFNIKRILSFHIISQIGYMLMGLAIYTPLAITCLLVTNPILVYPFPRQTKIMIPLPPQHWSEQIFGCANLGDKRRTKRLVKVAGDLSAHTGSSLATSCSGNLAAVEGAYRLIENEAVEPDAIAEAGFQATAVAANDYQLILAIEDSTTLSYKHSVRSELGDIGGPENSISKGIWAHSVMLLDVDSERTIGLIDQQRWIRNDDDRGKKHERKQRPYEDKESFKWQKSSENIEHRLGVQISKVISVCDREADVYEYIRFQLTHGRRFVVRATQNRILIDDERLLFDALSAEPVLGKYTVDVPQRGGRKARKATLQVKKKTVTIQSPQRPGGRLEPITVNILVAEEISNGTEDRLCWILLTSEPIETFECCRKILRFYELRWRIEEFHKAWKTGAGVERLRLLCADNLQRLAVILMFVAVRLLQIREALMLPYKRQKKDDNTWNENTLADCVVGDEEWKVLWLTYYEGKPLPDAVPTLSWLLHTVAKVGGWCDSKRTGIPGWLVVWKGWAKLQDRLHTYRMTRGVEM